jgi:hypothetical protein
LYRKYQQFSPTLHQIGHSVVRVASDPYNIEDDVTALDQANLVQALAERFNERPIIGVGR